MFWSVLVAEQSKIFKRKILWVELVILSVAAIFLLAASYPMANKPETIKMITWPEAPSLLLRQFTNMAGLFVVILVASVVAQEYGWRTVHLLLSRGIPRPTLLGAKFGATIFPVLLIVVAPLVISIPVTALFTQLLMGALDPGQVSFARLAVAVLGAVYALLPYAAGGFALAVLSRSTVTAIGAGVAFALTENILLQLLNELGGLGTQIAQFFPAMLSGSVLRGLTQQTATPAAGNGQHEILFLDPVLAALAIALYTALFLSVSVLAFSRQDLTG